MVCKENPIEALNMNNIDDKLNNVFYSEKEVNILFFSKISKFFQKFQSFSKIFYLIN